MTRHAHRERPGATRPARRIRIDGAHPAPAAPLNWLATARPAAADPWDADELAEPGRQDPEGNSLLD